MRRCVANTYHEPPREIVRAGKGWARHQGVGNECKGVFNERDVCGREAVMLRVWVLSDAAACQWSNKSEVARRAHCLVLAP